MAQHNDDSRHIDLDVQHNSTDVQHNSTDVTEWARHQTGWPLQEPYMSNEQQGNGTFRGLNTLPPTMLGVADVAPPPAADYGAMSMTIAAPVSAAERDRLLVEHLPTVRFIARRIHERLPQHVEIDDLVSAGIVGLIDAFSKFDRNKQVQFKSYAQFRIRGAILDSLRTLDWSPRELRRKGRAIEETIRTLTQQFGRAPSEGEIATGLDMSLNDYQQVLGELKGLEIGSLNLERNEDSGDDELAYVPGAPEEDPLFRCLKGELKQHLVDAIEALPDRERMVLTLYYYEELTMKEIGLALGVVESRVSQIHSAAVLRLRVALADLRSRSLPPIEKKGKKSRGQ